MATQWRWTRLWRHSYLTGWKFKLPSVTFRSIGFLFVCLFVFKTEGHVKHMKTYCCHPQTTSLPQQQFYKMFQSHIFYCIVFLLFSSLQSTIILQVLHSHTHLCMCVIDYLAGGHLLIWSVNHSHISYTGGAASWAIWG